MSDSSSDISQHSFDDFKSSDDSDKPEKTDRNGSVSDSNGKTPEIKGGSFNSYWFQRNEERNIEENHEERNEPGHSWPVGRFEPHQLGNCKRKWVYQWLNAPKENQDPHGIFAIGHFIEEDIIEPWLRDTFEPEYDIDNAVHVSVDIETIPVSGANAPTVPGDGVKEIPIPDNIGYNQPNNNPPRGDADEMCLTVAGSTDPAICDSETGEILALTEVKSTGSIGRVNKPKRMHKMQLHAYMKSLGITDGYVIYVDRDELLDPKVFKIDFDEDVWQTVIDWMSETLTYAANRELPPADAPESWMCNYCDYANRCGEGRSNLVSDMGPKGFVAGVTNYPRNMVEDHLEAYPDVVLSPSLALAFPDLAEQYNVESWVCPSCTATFEYTDEYFTDFDNKNFDTPSCPACQSIFDDEIFLVTSASEE